MSIASKNVKGYLEIEDRTDGLSIRAQKRHAGELQALFWQHGVSCRRQTGPQGDTLLFDAGADRHRVEEILTGYGEASGS